MGIVIDPRLLIIVIICLISLPLQAVQTAPQVLVKGIKGKVLENVETFINLQNASCGLSENRLEVLMKQTTERIHQGLQAFGYYNSNIKYKLSTSKECWNVNFDIKTRRRVRIRNVDIQIQGPGRNDPAFTQALSAAVLRPGMLLRHDYYEKAKQSIIDIALQKGYLEGEFTTHELRVNPSTAKADIILHYATGERFTFGEIHIDQDVVRPNLVKRFMQFEQGEPFDNELIIGTYRALAQSRYFSTIQVRPELSKAVGDAIPMNILLKPGKRQVYSAGVGFATDTGPRARLDFTNKRVNTYGHILNAKLGISKIEKELSMGYRIPLHKPTVEYMDLAAGFKREDTDAKRSDIAKFRISETKQLGHGWLQRQFVEFLHEGFEVGEKKGSTQLIMPGLGVSKVEADNRLFPNKGYRLDLEIRGSPRVLFSDLNMLQLTASGKGVYRLPLGFRMITRTNLGASILSEFKDLPASLRFFAGGDNSVRGYGFESLGPVDDEGGRNLITGSVELDYFLTNKWGAALFLDSGNAFNFENINLKTGIGLGIRWRSPVGPLRFDLAVALDKRVNPVRFHFSMGPEL